jgi:hypothetical protein
MSKSLSLFLALCLPLSLTSVVAAQIATAVVRVDGDNGVPNPPGQGDGWNGNAYWGPCGSPFPVSPPQSVVDCMQEYGLNAEDLAKCIEAMILAGTP